MREQRIYNSKFYKINALRRRSVAQSQEEAYLKFSQAKENYWGPPSESVPYWHNFNFISYIKTLFPNTFPFSVTEVRISTYFGGHNSAQNTWKCNLPTENLYLKYFWFFKYGCIWSRLETFYNRKSKIIKLKTIFDVLWI